MHTLRELWQWVADIWDSGQFYGRMFIVFVLLWLAAFIACSFSGAPMELAAAIGITPIITIAIWVLTIGPMPFILIAVLNNTVGRATGRKIDFGSIPRFFGGVLLLGFVLSIVPWKNDPGASLLIAFFALIIGARRWGRVRRWLRIIEDTLLDYALPIALAVLVVVLFYGGRGKAEKAIDDPATKAKVGAVYENIKRLATPPPKTAPSVTDKLVDGLRNLTSTAAAASYSPCAGGEFVNLTSGAERIITMHPECRSGWVSVTGCDNKWFANWLKGGIEICYQDGFCEWLPENDVSWHHDPKVNDPKDVPGRRDVADHGKIFNFRGEGDVKIWCN
jgi:hypothetical protein